MKTTTRYTIKPEINKWALCPFILLTCLFLASASTSYGQFAEGTIQNKATGKAIPFVNISLPTKDMGTVSSEAGKFSLKMEGVDPATRMRISCIGFISRELSLHEFTDSLNTHAKHFSLQPDTLRIAEITIKPRNLERALVGNTHGGLFKKAGFGPNDDLGREMASFIPVQHENSFIEKVHVKIAQNTYGKIKLRLNVYETQGSLPGKRLNTVPIYVETDIRKGICEFDVSEYNLRVDHDCFISIEYIEKMGDSGLYFAFSYDHYPSYWRLTSDSPWVKGEHDNKAVSVSLSALVSFEKISP